MNLLTPEELLEIGLGRSQVVMANEAHDGLRRSIRTREIGRRLLPVAHRLGVRHFAMEALDRSFADRANRERLAPKSLGYLGQPEMRRLVQGALDLGMTLVAYEAEFEDEPDTDPLSMEATNRRELEQARNLAAALPDGPLLVWCGNGHLSKHPSDDWQPMGFRFRELTGIEPFAIDQTVTVAFEPDAFAPWIEPLRPTLESLGGSAGFLAESPPIECDFGWADAYVLSLDNELS